MVKVSKKETKKKPKKILVPLIIIFIIVAITSYYILSNGNQEKDYTTSEEAYLDKIVLDSLELRIKASEITRNCESGDKECQLNMIYRYIGDNYNYYSDPRTSEFIQYPNETMKLLGGDCEDLTILMESLLESIGIKTYFVFTEDHAYLLACGIDVNKLQVEILNSSIVSEDEKINLYHETVSIPSNSAMYYGGNGDSTDYQIKLLYNLDSNIPINVNIVNSKIALNQWTNGDSYIYYPSCSKEDLYEWSNECQIDKIGGLLIINNNNESAKVNLKIDIEYNLITQKLDLSNFSTKYYKIDNEKCISLEATAGKYGYPGMNIELKGNNTAIDPLTKERYNLV